MSPSARNAAHIWRGRDSQSPRRILLTGATGLLGRYLLHDLALAGYKVTVLVRDQPARRAADRVAAILDSWTDQHVQLLTAPKVIAGDLRKPRLGLSPSDFDALAGQCDAIVHAAASLAFQPTLSGEPRATNVEGTRELLRLCRRMKRPEFHFVSTAYVCGSTTAIAFEDGPVEKPVFRNEYERSKFDGERLLRDAIEVQTTIYRPSVIVGDSRTGQTSSYEGIYRLWELGARLAGPNRSAPRVIARLPWTGDELRNLVPVDWVSDAIVRLIGLPPCHGRTYHLVAKNPVPIWLLKSVADKALNLEPWRLAGPDILQSLTPIEATVLEHCRDFAPYLLHDPKFDRRNLDAALPGLPEPPLDREALTRLIRFAVADNWGRRRATRRSQRSAAEFDHADYLERFLPIADRRIGLLRLTGLSARVSIEIFGIHEGRWSCQWVEGELRSVTRGPGPTANIRLSMDAAAFADIVRGRMSAEEAFQARRLRVAGDLELALKLGAVFAQLLKQFPYRPPGREEWA